MRKSLLWLPVIAGVYSCTHPSSSQPSPNWQNQDLQSDSIFGISTEKAYARLLKDKKATTVIVAVIDSGIDTAQEDLSPVLWTDPENGSHGRNFLGPETGKEDFIPMMANTKDTRVYRNILDDYNVHVTRLESFMTQLRNSKKILDQIEKNIGKDKPSRDDLKKYQPRNDDERRILDLVSERMPQYPDFASLKFCEVDQLLELGQYHLDHALNRERTAEDTVGSARTGENNTDLSSNALGLVTDPNVAPCHGTHMAGIIAAARNNGKGIDGIADHAQIMMIKLFNTIRETRDDGQAQAIRFAVDHGARIISMSFGKTFSLHKQLVDEAVQYAMSRNVLLVHSSGNNGMDLDADSNSFYPSPKYLNGAVAPAWITVGASGYRDDSTLVPSFSNYGHTTVDVFAPGVSITSTIPHSGLATWDGTSQAAPVVAGLAALIWTYYPQLMATQVKDIIMRSVVQRTTLKNKCVSGGVANAYNALLLAAGYK